MACSHWHKGHQYWMQRERKSLPPFEVLRAKTVGERGREGGEAGNYEWRRSLTDYYIKARRRRRISQTRLTSVTVLVSTYQWQEHYNLQEPLPLDKHTQQPCPGSPGWHGEGGRNQAGLVKNLSPVLWTSFETLSERFFDYVLIKRFLSDDGLNFHKMLRYNLAVFFGAQSGGFRFFFKSMFLFMATKFHIFCKRHSTRNSVRLNAFF